jgi:hypothetical protein
MVSTVTREMAHKSTKNLVNITIFGDLSLELFAAVTTMSGDSFFGFAGQE